MFHPPRSLMLFAAGLGTRMHPLTAHRPKPLIEVGGMTLLDHALHIGREAGAKPIVVNLHYRGSMIREHLAHEQDVLFSDEQPEILETGGGLRAALPLLGAGSVMTLNADAVWTGPNPLKALQGGWNETRMDACLMLVPRSRAMGHSGPGDFALESDGRISRGGPYVYTGAQILKTGRLAQVAANSFSLNLVWDMMAADGRLFGAVHHGGWCDVGRPASLAIAEALLSGVADV